MLTNLYVLIIIIPIVQITLCQNLNTPLKSRYYNYKSELGKRSRPPLRNDERYFENVVESVGISSSTKRAVVVAKKRAPKSEKNYQEIKSLLSKLLVQIVEMEKQKRDDSAADKKVSTPAEVAARAMMMVKTERAVVAKPNKKKKKMENRKARWGHWTDWSSCSVSCGKGRQIRWRHCIDHCEEAETEMEEKSCQLPACGPGKLFGVIQLR